MVDNQLGRNIQSLRESYGETLEELGSVICCAKSTVKGYENGSRTPDSQILQKISSHYYVPVDELLKSDLTGLKKCKLDLNSPALMVDWINKIYPLYCSESALMNKNFKKGYELALQLLDDFSKAINPPGDIIVRIIEAFSNAANESEKPEAHANLLWGTFIFWDQMGDTQTLLSLQSKQLSNQLSLKDLMKMRDDQSEKIKNEKRSFIDTIEPEINKILKSLRSTDGWSDLADYYLALKYIVGIVNTDLPQEMNAAVGNQMMQSFSILGNRMALEFLLFANSFRT